MTTTQSRQARRATQCIKLRKPRGSGPSDPTGLARVAERVAHELELSPEMIDELLHEPVEESLRIR